MSMGIVPPSAASSFAHQIAQSAPSAQSMLAKGAEELSFGVTANRKPGLRRITKFNPLPRRDKINQVLALLEAGATSGARFTRLQRLSKNAQSSTEDIDSFLKQNGLNPEDSMLLLQQILNDLDAQGDHTSAFCQSVIAAQQALDDDMGLEIRARLHSLEIALREGMDQTQTVNYQDGYLALILSSGSCAAALDELLRRFNKRLRSVLALLIKTLGQELDSQWTSCEPGYLQLLRQALYEVGGIANTYDDCEELSARWQDRDALLLDDPVQLTRDLVRVSAEPWAIGMKFTGLADKYSTVPWRLRFIVRLRKLVHAMPYLLFCDEEAQQRVFEAVQQALDDAADKEPL
jgi:type III secretion system TyeA family effector delivery regulator